MVTRQHVDDGKSPCVRSPANNTLPGAMRDTALALVIHTVYTKQCLLYPVVLQYWAIEHVIA
jgi:hypothetical protein